MLRRFALPGLAAALLASAAVAGPGVPGAEKIKPVLQEIYGKVDFRNDAIAFSSGVQKIGETLGKEKAKVHPLKTTSWWSEQIQEALYSSGSKWIAAPPKTKDVVTANFESDQGGRRVKGSFVYRGPSKYSSKRSVPMLLSIVDSKTDPAAHLKKTWMGGDEKDPNWPLFEEFRNEWLLVCVAESDAFDVSKDALAPIWVYLPLRGSFNIDPNRIFVEGVGSACKSAQFVGSFSIPDRMAGLVLRNPQEATLNENAGIFPTVVVRGPEGAEKATAAFAKIKETVGEAHAVELATSDVASVEGACAPLGDWLKAAKPREVAKTFTWVLTKDRNGAAPNICAAGSIKVRSALKNELPTRIGATYKRPESPTAPNVVSITAENLDEFTLCLNDDLVDLDKPVAIMINGAPVGTTKTYERSVSEMLTMANDWGEYGQLFPVQIPLRVPQAAVAAKNDGEDPKKDEGGEKKPDEKK